jgi:hypothetical protein
MKEFKSASHTYHTHTYRSYTQKMEYYSAIKKNKSMLSAENMDGTGDFL